MNGTFEDIYVMMHMHMASVVVTLARFLVSTVYAHVCKCTCIYLYVCMYLYIIHVCTLTRVYNTLRLQ